LFGRRQGAEELSSLALVIRKAFRTDTQLFSLMIAKKILPSQRNLSPFRNLSTPF
jgi:hypothetical protein